ncbi:Aminocarboxymuconate-semialdehyde decarboxylase [Paramicrosporidium saccamoebae]|uniref:2-amino-3-carboxymuconate-6-semialdehyde decarboxylase n=1 Tax=Paramicrosporidium saccamoebae TaxID=1246581 RepID=A0A2H9TPJ0_9FUNG|nr:Aminocarboxymuconate-semialdehyde decarboxylase [Paramicrosporidium saccamoebae]
MHHSLEKIKKIDLHTHIIPESWPDWNKEFGRGRWLTIRHDADGAKLINADGTLFRAVEKNCYCPAKRLEECDTTDVLSTVPGIGFNYGAPSQDALRVAQFLNDHIGQVIKSEPKRFVGLGTIPLQDSDLAIIELKRCVTELGMAGVQIGSHVDGRSLDDSSLEKFWTTVEELDCAVFVHPWDMSDAERVQKYWFPCHGFHARPDLCQTVTTTDPNLVHDPEILELLVKKFGEDRIILGSDYPFPLGEIDRPGQLIETTQLAKEPGDTERIRQKLLWKNAVTFLKLPDF